MPEATTYRWELIWQYRGELLHGLLTAVEVAAVSLVLSLVFGLLLALWRMSRPPVSWPAALYINVFRGVPALVTVLWVYFGWSLLLGITLTTFEAGVTALVLLYSAYLAEIFRSALSAIHPGQREAGIALGLKRGRVFSAVILPQAVRIAMPNLGSAFIGMVKDTSTFVVIGLVEVVSVSQSIVSTTFQSFVIYTAAGGLYVAVAFAADFLARLLEQSVGGRPQGALPRLVTARRRHRFEALCGGPLAAGDPLAGGH